MLYLGCMLQNGNDSRWISGGEIGSELGAVWFLSHGCCISVCLSVSLSGWVGSWPVRFGLLEYMIALVCYYCVVLYPERTLEHECTLKIRELRYVLTVVCPED